MKNSELAIMTNLLNAYKEYIRWSSELEDLLPDSDPDTMLEPIGDCLWGAIEAFITLLGVNNTHRFVQNTDGSYYEFSDLEYFMENLDQDPLEFLEEVKRLALSPTPINEAKE